MTEVSKGDTVYLIYVGLVTVQSVDDDGNISFYLYDDETLQTAHKPLYRTLDRLGYVRHPSINRDYTRRLKEEK